MCYGMGCRYESYPFGDTEGCFCTKPAGEVCPGDECEGEDGDTPDGFDPRMMEL